MPRLDDLAATRRIIAEHDDPTRRIAAVLAMFLGAVAGALLLEISLVVPLLAAATLPLLVPLAYVPLARREG